MHLSHRSIHLRTTQTTAHTDCWCCSSRNKRSQQNSQMWIPVNIRYIGNKPQNVPVFFPLDALCAYRAYRLSDSLSPFVISHHIKTFILSIIKLSKKYFSSKFRIKSSAAIFTFSCRRYMIWNPLMFHQFTNQWAETRETQNVKQKKYHKNTKKPDETVFIHSMNVLTHFVMGTVHPLGALVSKTLKEVSRWH